jgi:hypothetical protein
MHTEMGGSRAGFRDGGGRKVNGMSWNHELEETLEAAGKVGLRLEGDVVEMGVREVEEAERLGTRAGKWVGRNMLVGLLFRMTG